MKKSEFIITAETPRAQRKSKSVFSGPLALCSLCLGGQLFFSGCHQAHVANPLPQSALASDPDSQINFWHALTDQPICTNDEAFHGLFLYFDAKDDCADYGARVALLKSRHMLPSGFNESADASIERGTLAVALCEALRIKGGVTMQVFGQTTRYSSRELQFVGLFPPGSPQQTFSGNEYVGIIGRIEDYQRGDAANKPASEMQGHDGDSGAKPDAGSPPAPAGQK